MLKKIGIALLMTVLVAMLVVPGFHFNFGWNTANAQDNGGFVNQPAADATAEAVDCNDPQTGFVVNRPNVVAPELIDYLKGFKEFEWFKTFTSADTNAAGKKSNLADILGAAQAAYKAAGSDLEGRTIWFGFTDSQHMMDRVGRLPVSAANVDWLGAVGTFHADEMATWGKMTAEETGGGALYVFSKDTDIGKVFKNLKPGWFGQRADECPKGNGG